MNLQLVERIAAAVLYEGYMLYPYRATAVKNRQRWNFGALCPESYSAAQGGTEAWTMQTQCLVHAGADAVLDVKLRFLHLLEREVGAPVADGAAQEVANLSDDEIQARDAAAHFQVVESLDVGGQLFQTWQEAVEREVCATNLNLGELLKQPHRQTFAFPSSRALETLRDADGRVGGIIVRRQQSIEGAIELRVEAVEGVAVESDASSAKGLFRLTARILNLTTLEDAGARSRDDALMRSLVSTHTILGAREGGEFVSMLEPPEAFREAVASCENTGTWPVMVGDEGARDCMLSSPIILYDYPQIAPESPGDLFDGTEIDEILTLRIMTLTDEEKREMRSVDEHARRILERTETMPGEELLRMHGMMKGKSS